MPVWFRKNGGNWNLDASANPATGVGGFSFAGVRGKTLYVCGQGADSNIAVNFGQSAFSYPVPSGFTAGWPAIGGGWSSFDPAKNVGPVTLSNGNRTFTLSSFNGMVQSVDGYQEGSFYVEFTNVFNTFFTNGAGLGLGREYPGIDAGFWDSGGLYGSSDPHGGVGLFGGSLGSAFHAKISNQGVANISDFGVVGNGDIISIAAILEPIQFGMTELDLVQDMPNDHSRDVTMRYSDDGGANWSEPLTQTLGDIGQYEKIASWRRLGMARDRVWEFSWSCMFSTALAGIFVDSETSGT